MTNQGKPSGSAVVIKLGNYHPDHTESEEAIGIFSYAIETLANTMKLSPKDVYAGLVMGIVSSQFTEAKDGYEICERLDRLNTEVHRSIWARDEAYAAIEKVTSLIHEINRLNSATPEDGVH